MAEIELGSFLVPLGLLGLVVLAAIFFSRQKWTNGLRDTSLEQKGLTSPKANPQVWERADRKEKRFVTEPPV